MKFFFFHLMPYLYLDAAERAKYDSAWMVMPNRNYDPERGHDDRDLEHLLSCDDEREQRERRDLPEPGGPERGRCEPEDRDAQRPRERERQHGIGYRSPEVCCLTEDTEGRHDEAERHEERGGEGPPG